MENIVWLKKKTWIRSLPKTAHMSKHDELISTPLVGKVRHQIKPANFEGGCGVSKQECSILHSFQSVQFIKVP